MVYRVELRDGTTVIAKQGELLTLEARSLETIAAASKLPVARVLHATDRLLVMSDLGESHGLDDAAERHAAELLAELHAATSGDGRFGLGFDNLIGPLEQPNGWAASWVEFYRDCRLSTMADAALREGWLPPALHDRLLSLSRRVGELIPDRPAASLVHGDVWGGNVIAGREGGRGGRIVGFIDPAPHYAHAEVELAFITMFNTFGGAFFDRYHELRPIDPDFRRVRRDVYLLYPLLTHVRIYRGGGYAEPLARTLARLGF